MQWKLGIIQIFHLAQLSKRLENEIEYIHVQ